MLRDKGVISGYRKIIPQEILIGLVEFSKFVSHKAKISGELDSGKDSHPMKLD